ncbi:riboflavin synthase [Candidatus Daviesbacteria bacterium]|nr:riboflavin synthase [Candidatus Daviesbacteria bacterium]
MFTGIITSLGHVAKKTDKNLTILADRLFLLQIQKGSSISVNGTCLTVAQTGKQSFTVDFMPETSNKTNIQNLKINSLVNLELPATAASFLSGHLVQGHVDSTATLISLTKQENSSLLKFSIPADLAKYIVEKGSIAVNGISLTVIKVGKNYFTVGIIPYTWNNTMLKTIKPEDLVNIEVDILTKYVERLLK